MVQTAPGSPATISNERRNSASSAVAIGAADTAASLLAANLPPLSRTPAASGPSPGPWGLLTLGTGGQLLVPAPPIPDIPFPDYPDPGVTNLFRSADGGTYRLAAAQNVGVTLDWVRRTLDASWDELYQTAARPWRADTPVFLPYLAYYMPGFHPWKHDDRKLAADTERRLGLDAAA